MSTLPRAAVPTAFDEAAARYDLMVGLNPGYHRHLHGAAAALLDLVPPGGVGVRAGQPLRLLDLGCGSGASTRALLLAAARRGMELEVVGVDGSNGMLDRARAKDWPASVNFCQARAEELTELAATQDWLPFDGVLAAYLFRNVTDADIVLDQVSELLRPGGALVVQEYSVADSVAAARRWSVICRLVVGPLSRLLSGNPELYRYLWQSVADFETVPQFAARLIRAGFTAVEHRTVNGWQRDILHLIRGIRP